MKRRDEDDFAGFVRGQSGALFRTAYLLTGDYQRAEDLLLDTLARVYQRWSRISSTAEPDGYARSVLVSRATSRRRRRSSAELPPLSADAFEDPEHAERVAVSRTVWNAVLSLPPRQRAVVVLRCYDDLSEAEAAETLGLAPGTVRGLEQAAGERLAVLLAGTASSDPPRSRS